MNEECLEVIRLASKMGPQGIISRNILEHIVTSISVNRVFYYDNATQTVTFGFHLCISQLNIYWSFCFRLL